MSEGVYYLRIHSFIQKKDVDIFPEGSKAYIHLVMGEQIKQTRRISSLDEQWDEEFYFNSNNDNKMHLALMSTQEDEQKILENEELKEKYINEQELENQYQIIDQIRQNNKELYKKDFLVAMKNLGMVSFKKKRNLNAVSNISQIEKQYILNYDELEQQNNIYFIELISDSEIVGTLRCEISFQPPAKLDSSNFQVPTKRQEVRQTISTFDIKSQFLELNKLQNAKIVSFYSQAEKRMNFQTVIIGENNQEFESKIMYDTNFESQFNSNFRIQLDKLVQLKFDVYLCENSTEKTKIGRGLLSTSRMNKGTFNYKVKIKDNNFEIGILNVIGQYIPADEEKKQQDILDSLQLQQSQVISNQTGEIQIKNFRLFLKQQQFRDSYLKINLGKQLRQSPKVSDIIFSKYFCDLKKLDDNQLIFEVWHERELIGGGDLSIMLLNEEQAIRGQNIEIKDKELNQIGNLYFDIEFKVKRFISKQYENQYKINNIKQIQDDNMRISMLQKRSELMKTYTQKSNTYQSLYNFKIGDNKNVQFTAQQSPLYRQVGTLRLPYQEQEYQIKQFSNLYKDSVMGFGGLSAVQSANMLKNSTHMISFTKAQRFHQPKELQDINFQYKKNITQFKEQKDMTHKVPKNWDQENMRYKEYTQIIRGTGAIISQPTKIQQKQQLPYTNYHRNYIINENRYNDTKQWSNFGNI